MSYFISFQQTVQITPEEFGEELRRKWHSIQKDTFRGNLLTWWIDTQGFKEMISLHPDMSIISVSDSPEFVARFVIWLRDIIDSEHDLMVTHDSSSTEILVTSQMSELELLDSIFDLP